MIEYEDCKREIAFTHVGEDGVVTVIAIERLLNDPYVRSTPVIDIAITKEGLEHVFKKSGLEMHRLYRITTEDLIRYPIHFIEWGDSKQTLVDGNHRFAYAGIIGRKRISGRIIDPEYWRPYVVVNLPELYLDSEVVKAGLQESFSGIA